LPFVACGIPNKFACAVDRTPSIVVSFADKVCREYRLDDGELEIVNWNPPLVVLEVVARTTNKYSSKSDVNTFDAPKFATALNEVLAITVHKPILLSDAACSTCPAVKTGGVAMCLPYPSTLLESRTPYSGSSSIRLKTMVVSLV